MPYKKKTKKWKPANVRQFEKWIDTLPANIDEYKKKWKNAKSNIKLSDYNKGGNRFTVLN